MSELCMRRTEGPLEITGGPTIRLVQLLRIFRALQTSRVHP